MRFDFEISKEAGFAYWVQTLVNWSSSFQRRANEYYLNKLGALTEDQNIALSRLGDFLRRKDVGYIWLWDIYTNSELNSELLMEWNSITSVFQDEFEKIWTKEEPKLLVWKDLLEKQNHSDIDLAILKTANFMDFRIEEGQLFHVILLPFWDKNMPTGHSKREKPYFVVSAISSISHENVLRVLNNIYHEAIHTFGYGSKVFEPLLEEARKNIIEPTEFKITGQAWKSLLTETVITSIAGKRLNNYLGSILATQEKGKEMSVKDEEELLVFDFEKHKENSGFLIRKTASLAAPLTAKYLDSGQKMNLAYAEKIAKIWINLKSE